MKKLGLLVLAVVMISLSSCGNGENANKAKEGAGQVVDATKDAVKDAADKTVDAAKDAGNAVKDAAGDAVDAAKDAGNAVKDAAGNAVDAAKDAVTKADGKALFMSNGCVACHQMDKKTVGPAVKTIGKAYAGKKDALAKFLKGEGKAIVDPAQFAVMQPNLATTKKLSDGERAALADYFLNSAK